MAGVLVEPTPTEQAIWSRRVGPRNGERQRDLVVVAHRGPVRFEAGARRRVIQRNNGGLVTALRDLMRHVPRARFLCAAVSPEDRAAAAVGWQEVPCGDQRCRVRMLDIDRRAHHDLYAVIANPLLWFVQHSLWRPSTAPPVGSRELDAWDHGYVVVNQAFANALADRQDVPAGTVVMVHDYHFYLVPQMVRDRRPDLFVHFFVHIPWPQPDTWRVLPRRMRDALFLGLLGSDIVGFHTEGYARNFLRGCQELLGLDVDYRNFCVWVRGRSVAVRFYPISVDESTLQELASSPATARFERGLRSSRAGKLILRVDRTDPSKNIVRGFRAFDRMLDAHPELEGRVTFLALLQPSRQDVPQYANYLREIRATVAEINERRERPGWVPIDLRLCDDLPMAIAAYKHFDVLMVNSLSDGMNLVSKEGILLNESDGVLALSDTTGAYEELGAVAVTLQPFDVDQQAHALYVALTMPQRARRLRREFAADIVRTNNTAKWLRRQLADIEALRAARFTPRHAAPVHGSSRMNM